MPIHPDYKMLSDDDVNMQLAEGIYDPNDPNLFNDEEWARNKNRAQQSLLPTQNQLPQQSTSSNPEQVLQYLSRKYPQAQSLLQKAQAKKGNMGVQKTKDYVGKLGELARPTPVREQNEVFPDMHITGRLPPLEQPRPNYYDGLPEWGGNEPEEPMISEQVGEVPPRSEIVEQDLPPEIEPRLENTTIGKMAMSAKDPRLLMAHLAQFAGEFGNLRGKPTESTAMPFYKAQIGLEQQQQENAFKQQQLDNQKQKAEDPALSALRRVQTDLATNKLQTEQELLDPNSERSVNLRETMRELAARQGYTFPKNDSLRGADALKMIQALMQEMQMSAQMGRTVYTTEAAAKEKEAERALREKLAAENAALQKELAEIRRKAGIDIKKTIPGKAEGAGGATGQKAFSNTSALRKEYQSHPITKKTMEIADSFNKIKSVFQTGTAGGDMSGVFMFMKLLDPGSTVREGEYKSAAEATGALDRLMNYKDKLEKGTILNPSQRQDFMQIAEKFYKAQMKEQNRLNQEFTDLASKSGLNPKDLMLLTGEKRKAKSIDELPDVK